MKKRGQSLVLLTLIVVIVAVVVAFAYPRIAKAYEEGEFSKKVAASRDFALTLNTLCSYPYDIEVEYEIDLSRFIVEISEGSVKLYDNLFVSLDPEGKIHGKDPTFAEYNFVCNQDINFIIDKPQKIIFNKKDGKIEVKAQK